MDSIEISGVFNFLHPWLLGTLSLVAALLYLYRYYRHATDGSEKLASERRAVYLVRFLYWLIFSFTWYLFPSLPTIEGRATLRISLACVIFAEVLYNFSYIHFGNWGVDRIGHSEMLGVFTSLAARAAKQVISWVGKWTHK